MLCLLHSCITHIKLFIILIIIYFIIIYYNFFFLAVLGLQVFCKLKVVNLKCLSKSVGLLYKERRGMQMHLSVNT